MVDANIRKCRDCKNDYHALSWHISRKDYQCSPCRSIGAKAYKDRRKAEGRPVKQLPIEWHREYNKTYNQKPEVKAKVRERIRKRSHDPVELPKLLARRKLRREIAAGRIIRQSCQVCGDPRTHGHHTDYSRPLDVMWLCPLHHAYEHMKMKAGA